MFKNNLWTESELEIIRQEYNGRTPSLKCQQALKNMLGCERTVNAIQHKSGELGLRISKVRVLPRQRENWTEEEDEYLREHRQDHSIYWLSKQMGRTVKSINWRCSILNVNGNGKNGWYNLIETARILGITHHTMTKLIEEKKIKSTEWVGEGGKQIFHEISEDAIYAFCTKYPYFLQNRRPDMVQLINILTKGGIKYKI